MYDFIEISHKKIVHNSDNYEMLKFKRDKQLYNILCNYFELGNYNKVDLKARSDDDSFQITNIGVFENENGLNELHILSNRKYLSIIKDILSEYNFKNEGYEKGPSLKLLDNRNDM